MSKNKVHWRKLALLICIFISYLSPPAMAQKGSSCDSAFNLLPVAPGGPFTPTTWASGTTSYYIHFTAYADSMAFDVDTLVTNPAEIVTAELYDNNNCPLTTPIATHSYSTGLVFTKAGLTVGNNYYIKITKSNCSGQSCYAQEHQLKVRLTMVFTFCVYLSNSVTNPDNTGNLLLITADPFGSSLDYLSPDFTVSAACSTLCFSGCFIIDELAQSGTLPGSLSAHPFTITGPLGYSINETTVIANGGCFSLPTPGVYTFTDIHSGGVVHITLSGATTPALNILPLPNVCTLAELVALFPAYLQNLSYYPGVVVTVDGTPVADLTSLCPGPHILEIDGYDLCGNNSYDAQSFNVNPISGTVSVTGSCGNKTFTPSLTCASAVSSFQWDFGDGGTSTTTGVTTHTYATSGTYGISVIIDPNYPSFCDDPVFIDQTVVVAPPSATFTLTGGCNLTATITPTYTCSSLISSVLWNFGDGTTSAVLTPGSHTYASAGTYTVTLTYSYVNNNFGTITTVTQTVTQTITVNATPTPTISVPENTCSNGTVVVTGATGITYTILSGSATLTPIFAGIWNISGYGAGDVVIQFNYTISGCTGSSVVTIEGCCQPVPTPSTTVFYTYPNTSSTLNDYLGSAVWPGTTTGTTSIVGATIYIYDDLILNKGTLGTPFSFQNCTLLVYPGKKMEVFTNNHIYFKDCVVKNMCPEMWDGLYLPVNNTKVTAVNTRFEQALNAIVSNSGGVFNISGTTATSQFVNCWKGIVINGWPAALNHTGVVRGTRFTSTTGALLPPHSGAASTTYEGIEINGTSVASIGHITIGSVLSDPDRLEFNNMNYGLKSIYYDVDNYNSYYTNIIHTTGPAPIGDCETGTAVCIRGGSHTTVDAQIGGTGAFDRNIFNYCYNGINTMNYVELLAQSNQINNITRYGIFCNLNTGKLIQIKDNVFKTYDVGIRCYNSHTANITISGNIMNQGGGPLVPVTVGNVGILMEEATPQPSSVYIHTNALKYNNTGIWLRNVQRASIYNINTNDIRVINTTPSVSNKQYGIRMENANGVRAIDNTIWKSVLPSAGPTTATPLPTTATYQYLFGITTELSANCEIKQNHIYKMGRGIYAQNNCSGTYYLCNDFNRCFTGLYFNNASIPSQYTFGSTVGSDQGNAFYNHLTDPIAYRYEGSVLGSTTTVYRQTSVFYTNVPSLTTGIFYTTPLIGAVCGAALPPPEDDEREAAAGQTVREEYEYATDSTEHVYWDKQQAYKFLIQSPELLTLGVADDADYANFVNAEKTSGIGQANEVYRLIGTGEQDSAQVANSSRTAANDMEQNSINVSNIYLKILHGDTLTHTDSSNLYDIAWADPFKGGEAVYMARVILGIDPTQSENDTRLAPAKTADQQVINAMLPGVQVYPNPANDQVQVELEASPDQNWQMVVMDVTGKTIVSRVPQQINLLDVKNWPEGLYMLVIRQNGINVNEQKLIIQH